MKKGYKSCLLLGILLILLGGCREKETPENADAGLEAEEEALQISFEGQDMDGNVISSSILSGSKVTMINVWATYCNPCLREMPGLGELAGEYDSGDFQIIGIVSDVQEGASDKALEYAESLIEQTGADYPHLLLNESLYRALLTEVSAVPTTFFFNEKGELLDVVVGSMEKSAWEEKVNGLLEKD
ncbi:MAG: TlpA family protein disulfide reductase [Lachnospiraceae bacterium]|nr:TlpA family protein disulfide reductase [Lachnospiraceae bacterium]